jgi:hypothetical protein
VDLPQHYFPGDDPERPPVNSWRPYGHLLLANWLGEIHRTAWPRLSDEPVLQWALAGSRPAHDGEGPAELLIAAAGGRDILPSALGLLADAGIALRRIKVHRQPGCGQLIELSLEPLAPPAIERMARRLCALATVLRVAFRSAGGIGGWLVGQAADTTKSQAPSDLHAPSAAA